MLKLTHTMEMENNLFKVGVLEGDHFISLICGEKFKVVNAVKSQRELRSMATARSGPSRGTKYLPNC